MRVQLLAFSFLSAALIAPAAAQVAGPPAPAVLFASPADVATTAAKIKSGLKPGQVMGTKSLVSAPPYRTMVEYRTASTPAAVHEKEAEFITVVAGSGTFVVGGTLKDQKRRNATNLSGAGINGGKSYAMEKGSFFFVPAGTPHFFAAVGSDGLAIVTLHVADPPTAP